MPLKSWKVRALPAISRYFNETPSAVYSERDLRTVLNGQRKDWRIPVSTSNKKLMDFLVEKSKLTTMEITSEHYLNQKTVRYSWGDASPFAVANSLRPNSYLCYSSAAFIHGLIDEVPHMIYVNKEQSDKGQREGMLEQPNIDRAFANKQRRTSLILSWDSYHAAIISGKQTGLLGVVQTYDPSGYQVRVTNLERTLIDMAVRPGYSGGVHRVLEAYQNASGVVSAIRLATLLKKLAYVYPYHQSIGFYLQKAGYPEKSYERFLQDGPKYNFYLDYAIKDKEYVDEWRLYVPKGFGLTNES